MARKKRRSAQEKRVLSLLSVLIFICASLIAGAVHLLRQNNPAQALAGSGAAASASGAASPDAQLSVHMIDVGQGDSLLIRAPEKTVLIDCGEKEHGATVEAYLHDQGIKTLDLVIASHPHSDHMGAMSHIVDKFPVGTFLMPVVPEDQTPTTGVYRSLLEALEEQQVKLTKPKPGTRYDLGGGAVLTLLSPDPAAVYDNLNDYSVVCRLDYGQTSFLFTGDAEKPVEKELLAQGADLGATVLKVGHHGSSSSTGTKFLQAVGPETALISCGIDNRYNHPHQETMDALKAQSVQVQRTDLDGTIVVESDGQSLAIATKK